MNINIIGKLIKVITNAFNGKNQKYDEKTHTKGSIVSKDFNFKNLIAINTNAVFDIFLENNPNNTLDSATVEAFEAQIHKIHLTEENGTLMVLADNGSYDKVKIILKSRNIKTIRNAGTGNISGSFEGEKLNISNGGTGDICLSGKVHSLEIKNSGTGNVGFDNLEAEKLDFTNSGTGDMTLLAKTEISGKNSGTGDIYYYGVKANLIKNTGVGDVNYRGLK